MSLKDKVIFVTGAASGLGRAAAIKFAQLGASLALTDIDEAGLLETAELTAPAPVITAVLDVSDDAQCTLVVAETVQYFSRLDHVFNCAGINPTKYPIAEVPDGYFDKLFAVNVRGTFNVTRAALRHMTDNAGCSFVNVSSNLGLRPGNQMAVYSATKHAVVGFSKSVALEVGARGIRVNVVAPGSIETPSNLDVVMGAAEMAKSAAASALGRMGQPDEVADVVAFLMSNEARYMNGSVVEVHGGMGY